MKTISFTTLSELKRHEGGLTSTEVAQQRARFGVNDIIEVAGHPWRELFSETLKDPMIWFLIFIGSVFFLTGQSTDAIAMFLAILPLLLMDAFLHWRTQASTATLKSQLNARVRVIRDSIQSEIDSRDLVPGDIVVISPGLLLPADGIFETGQEVQIDESVLTGESFPITKKPASFNPFELSGVEEVKIPAEFLGYAGTRVLTGQGSLRVLLTGLQTAYGEIVQSASQMPHERTPLQKSISRLVGILIYISAALCLFLAVLRMQQGHGWLDALLSAATLAIAAIPEEFPVVFTFFLGVGVYRLAEKRALVRRAVSIENIGRMTQLCTDKTGTITVGHLELTHCETAANIAEKELIELALAASSSETDPVDLAIRELADERQLSSPTRIGSVPFTEDRRRETGFIKTLKGSVQASMKGSPETILALSRLSLEDRERWKERVSEWAKGGHKVIACARKELNSSDALQEPHSEFEFCGLLAFEDPPRPEVAGAMSYCRQNGVRVLMITGDHPETAAAIAKDSGLTTQAPRVVSAEESPEKFQDDWLNANPNFLKQLDVVARCTPLQKLRIVNALKHSGELVAVTGDGVNDVPALKAADIGIAMGERGSRSAKEVSSIILADDNFNTIVNAIKEGRQLFTNLKMSFEYLLLIHFPLVLTAALIPLAGFPLLYLPLHIVWLELVIHPTAFLAFQNSASTRHKDLPPTSSFFSHREVAYISLVGLGVALALGLSFVLGMNEGLEVGHARAKAIAILTFWSAGLSCYLTQYRSRVANILGFMTMLTSISLIQFSDLIPSLHLTPLHLKDWLEAIGIVVLFIGAMSLLRRRPQA